MSRKTKKQTRRGKGEGSIYKKNGKWYGQVTIGYNATGKQVRKTFIGKTREEVAKMVTSAASQAFDGVLTVSVIAPDTTAREFLTDFLWIFKRPTVSDVTFEWYRNITEAHIIPALGTIAITELTPQIIQSHINKMYVENSLGDYPLHRYRHTFATMLLEEGVNPKVVQKLLGHSDIETTLGTYSHVLPEVFDGVAGIVGKIHTDMMSDNKKAPQLLERQRIA